MDLFSPRHLLVILLIFLILFGGKKIPELMRGVGEGIREFKKASKGEDPKETTDEKKETQK